MDNLNLSWHLKYDKKLNQYYCKATKYMGMVNGKPKHITIHLHTVISGFKKQHIDHLNHNTLDNRKCNLIDKTAQNNLFNRNGANKNSKTGVRNVSYDKRRNVYVVQLQINRKNTVLGCFNNLEDATRCAEECRNKYYPKVNAN